MFPCCNLTYGKYLNPDGSIDREELQKVLLERKDARTVDMLIGTPKIKGGLCTCECHKKGTRCLH